MNQFFAGFFVLFLTGLLWITGKRTKPRQLIFNKAIANINQVEERSLVNPKANKDTKSEELTPYKVNKSKFIPPNNAHEVAKLKRKLIKLMSGSSSERMEAIELAGQWEDRSIIPFLRRGLRDADSKIMIKAALYIEKFRGKPIKTKNYESERPPLNVFLMR